MRIFEAFWEHLKPFRELVIPQLSKVAKETGYDYSDGNGHHMMLERGKKLIKPHMYTKSLWGYNALAVEVKKQSTFWAWVGLLAPRFSAMLPFSPVTGRTRGGPRPAEYVGHRIDRETEVRTYLAHYMRDTNVIDRAIFKRIFGIDIVDAIPLALATWEKQGLIKAVTKKSQLNEQPRTERTRSLISIVPDEYLEYEVLAGTNWI